MLVFKKLSSVLISLIIVFSTTLVTNTASALKDEPFLPLTTPPQQIPKNDPQNPPYAPDVVLIGLEDGLALNVTPGTSQGYTVSTNSSDLNSALNRVSVKKATSVFPGSQSRNMTLLNGKKVNLSRIYRLELENGADIDSVIKTLSQTDGVIYAEPDYLAFTASVQPLNVKQLTVDDPLYGEQWGLSKINIENAWDDTYGDSKVILAFVDSGVDMTHVDLANKLWLNPGEIAGNGIDDDSNGLIDDINGWNFVDDNNNTADDNGHGTLTTGVAAASGGNAAGIIGVCPECSIMPVKAMQASGVANYSDIANGILYAAQKGARVINLSLGGYSDSNTLRSAVNAAVVTYGAVLVAGAGNDNLDQTFYPAAYDNVLAVAGTQGDDSKAVSSNYGVWVDVTAPAVDIKSTALGGDWVLSSGTSLAAPFASGLAGLLVSLHPTWTQSMIRSQIEQTADDIDSMNPGYSGLLGNGRLNAGAAMQEPHPILSMTGYKVNGLVNGRALIGETALVNVSLANDWSDAVAVTGSLSTADPLVSMVNSSSSFGNILAGAIATNEAAFTFTVGASTPYNHPIVFTLDVVDVNGYTNSFTLTVLSESGIEPKAGTITTNETWTNDKTYLLTNNVNIPTGVTLTIQPGTEVLFNGFYSLNVRGTLIADGTEDLPIYFKSNSAAAWDHLFFDDASVDAVADETGVYISGSILRHVRIEDTSGGIDCTTATPYMSYNNLDGGGIDCRLGATPMWLMDNLIIGGAFFIGEVKALRNTIHGEWLRISTGIAEGNKVFGSLTLESGIASGNEISKGNLSIDGPGGSITDNSVSGGNIIAGNNILVSNNQVTGSLIAGNGSTVDHNTVESGITVGNDVSVSWNTVEYYDGSGLTAGLNVNAHHNRLIGNKSGLTATTGVIEHNLITDSVGVALQTGAASVRYNSLIHNWGNTIVFEGGNPLVFSNNNIDFNYGAYDIFVNFGSTGDIIAYNNWWGSFSDTQISSRIFDWNDDDTKASVIFNPKLSEPDHNAPPYLMSVTISPDSTLGIETGTFEFEFSGLMDPNVKPILNFYTTNSPKIIAGGAHTCALDIISGKLRCWGLNRNGQATPPPGIYTQADAGGEFTCGMLEDGTIDCWGVNYISDPPPGKYLQVSTGGKHACALKEDGSVLCWGDNVNHQLDSPIGTFTQIDAGGAASCGLTSEGKLICWGAPSYVLAPPGKYVQVSVGGIICALKTDGVISCWGEEWDPYHMLDVPPGTYKQVSVGSGHICGLRENGAIVCWGLNNLGQSTVPTGTYTQVSCGGTHTCALLENNRIKCWGDNANGRTTVPLEMNIPIRGGFQLFENDQWLSPTKFKVTLESSSAIPRGVYRITVGDGLGLDGLIIASDQQTKFAIDYAGSVTDTTPPTTPEVHATGNAALTTISATWSSSDLESPITLYRYGVGTIPGGRDVVAWTYTSNTSMTHSGLNLKSDVIYYITVGARNEGGIWSESGISNGVINGTPLPRPFGKKKPTDKNLSLSSTLSWDASSDAQSYVYCYDTTNDNTCSSWLDNGTNTSVTVYGLKGNITYYWQVKAVSTNGNTFADNGTWWSFTTLNHSPVDNVKLTSSKVTFEWDAVPGATQYAIQLSTKSDFSVLVLSDKTSNTYYTYNTSLNNNTRYYWRIRPKIGVAKGSWSSAWPFYSMDPLAAPGLAAPENGSLRYPNLTLTWFSVTNAVQYQLQVARDSAFTNLVFKGKVPDTFKDFSDLAPGKYYWRVKSIEAGGLKSPWSQVRLFTVVKVFPPVLVSPGNEVTVNPDVTLIWEAPEFATQYKLQVSKDAAFTKLIVDEKTTALTKALTGLAARNYYWRVRAFTADGFKSPWSEVRKFTVVP